MRAIAVQSEPTVATSGTLTGMDAENVRLPDVWVGTELAGLVRAAMARRGVSYAEFTRTALRLLIWFDTEVELAQLRSAAPSQRHCIVCGQPYRGEVEHDGMAHAQCAAIIANLEKELAQC